MSDELKWIKHDSGECPVAPDCRVWVQERDGRWTSSRALAGKHWNWMFVTAYALAPIAAEPASVPASDPPAKKADKPVAPVVVVNTHRKEQLDPEHFGEWIARQMKKCAQNIAAGKPTPATPAPLTEAQRVAHALGKVAGDRSQGGHLVGVRMGLMS